uniref:Uncharacterized protein n=1 Tax=Rhizophora mucronata TaxID=61149 RepID=A0A2P2PCL5_RHIMU
MQSCQRFFCVLGASFLPEVLSCLVPFLFELPELLILVWLVFF